ncbi:guanine nucleotide-binding protein alpha subunit [Mycena polygramma]|nr:guanine nucleotide-binding protein alpha subunit [Mycena polygramma]
MLHSVLHGRTHHRQPSDPFSFPPPANESPAERQQRLALEQEMKRHSDQIDDDLHKERAERKKRSKREVKLLLLGQSESGKSTVLKNFRLKYAPAQWKAELRSWRAVIQLNLIQNVITILDVMQDRLAAIDSPTETGSPPSSPYGRASIDSDVTLGNPRTSAAVVLTQSHRLLNLRLSPLREVSDDLRRRLGAADPEFTFANGADGALHAFPEEGAVRKSPREFGVRGWIGALGLPIDGMKKRDEPTVDGPTEILATVRDDIIALWADPDVRALLRAEGVRVEDSPGFFLSETARISCRTYVPSDTDVVRARLRTVGVQEWRIELEQSNAYGSEWVIYDVGGCRSVRHAWVPYFDNVDAIIFLAPISCFNERLAEDPSVNRLEDTLLLWRAIVSSSLLKKTTLIVFLNKCDLLKRKLKSGIQVNKHLISFGNRENEVNAVVKYLKEKFRDVVRADPAGPRTTYLYATSATDTKATAATLNTVRDGLLREHLNNTELA